MSMITGRNIDLFSYKVTLSAMNLELKTGMKARRGYNPFQTIKIMFGLKGGKQKIYDQFKVIVENAENGIWPEQYKFRNSEDKK